MVVAAATFSGLGVLAFNALVLQHPLNGIDISLMCGSSDFRWGWVTRRFAS